MARFIEVEAFAKINIGLSVGRRGADGYHPISSVFHSIALSDFLRIGEKKGSGIELAGSFDCRPEATTIYKAAELFLDFLKLETGLKIDVEKRIPVQAGLGGGSADAAAVLAGLDRLFSTGKSARELAELGSCLGADVPFFLLGGAAYVTGRGECVEPLVPRPDLGILLLKPGFGIPTARAYAKLDTFRAGGGDLQALDRPPASTGSLASRVRASAMLMRKSALWTFKNDFGPLLYGTFPEYEIFEAALKEAGAGYISISGSGSCIYGVFESSQDAEDALGRVEERFSSTFGPKTLSGMALRAIKPLETSLVLR
ncbi:MAG: 4-(cytidine 5'-diphospho)-2-C-methyl-D-erythritol kinase [Spirochaetes bacterium]|nr:4-(cytidine 5'-diphospho)-2-C-methyl-D-erythritol kinase [Spirochaetota bacterium]